MRTPLLLASLAVLTSACTHHHKIATGLPLPADESNHARGALEGLGIGLLAGAASGAAVGLMSGDDPPCSIDAWVCFNFSASEKAAMLGVVGAGAGAITGLLVGAAIGSTDTYESDPLMPRISASVAPGQASANASWSF